MKIGIVRHFKVDYKPKIFMDCEDFKTYISDYDKACVIEKNVDMNNISWNKCYSSKLPRAKITASKVFAGNIESTELLNEVYMYPIRNLKVKIPSFLWSISSRIAWKKNHLSQIEGIGKTEIRARDFINKYIHKNNDNILIVSHGFFLITLIKELKKIGFKGEVPTKMENGILYILEK